MTATITWEERIRRLVELDGEKPPEPEVELDEQFDEGSEAPTLVPEGDEP